jgi:hypothetical protein
MSGRHVAQAGTSGLRVARARASGPRVERAGAPGPHMARQQSLRYLQLKRGRVEQ